MAYLNRITLIGNVGKDPEVRNFNDGNSIANFTLATTKRYTNRNGEPQSATTWHNIVVRGKAVDFVEKYVSKGDPLYVEGELVSRSYNDQNGNTRTVWEINSTQIQTLKQSGKSGQSAPVTEDLPF